MACPCCIADSGACCVDNICLLTVFITWPNCEAAKNYDGWELDERECVGGFRDGAYMKQFSYDECMEMVDDQSYDAIAIELANQAYADGAVVVSWFPVDFPFDDFAQGTPRRKVCLPNTAENDCSPYVQPANGWQQWRQPVALESTYHAGKTCDEICCGECDEENSCPDGCDCVGGNCAPEENPLP